MKSSNQDYYKSFITSENDSTESIPFMDTDSRLLRIKENWDNGERLMRRLVAKRMQSILVAKMNSPKD